MASKYPVGPCARPCIIVAALPYGPNAGSPRVPHACAPTPSPRPPTPSARWPMVLNILSGRVALWQTDDHLAGIDAEEPVPLHGLSSRPARGPQAGPEALRHSGLCSACRSVHSGLGFPLTATMCSGNTSDHTANRAHIAQLAGLLPERDEVTIVADCKLVDATTLGQLVTSGFHFVSLVPDAQYLRGNLIRKAWDKFENVEEWPILATKPGKRKASPRLHYRGMSFPAHVGMRIGDPDDKRLSAELMRGLVVYSEQLAARFDKSLAKTL